MKLLKSYILITKILATVLLLGKDLYFGPNGVLAGACDGLIIYAIWSPWFSMEEN